MVVLPWWAGRYRRLRLLYVAELEERARREEDRRAAEARRAVETERRRVALEMHDVVAHSLSVLVSQAEGGRMMAAKDPATSVRVLETIARAGREAMHDMGAVLRVLDPPEDPVSSPEPPQPGPAELPALLEDVRRSGLSVTFEEHGAPQPLGGAAGLAVYRVTQEALTNVLKHGGLGTSAEVRVTWRDRVVELRVANGIDGQQRLDAGSGRGLRGMEQRVRALGGSLRVATSGDRFTVLAIIPTTGEPPP
jgi:signal transduction histidine kinase